MFKCIRCIHHTALGMLLVCVTHGVTATQSLKLRSIPTGTLTYPLVDNLDFREGTFECWLKIAFDPADYLPAKEYQGLFSLVSLGGANGAMNLHYSATAGAKEPALWCSVGPKNKLTPFGANVGILKPDEWRHVALTWNRCDMALYFDSKKVGGFQQNDFIYRVFGETANCVILAGDKWNVGSLFTIDDLRVSRVARMPDELGFHGALKPDPYTSVLDPFECDFVPDGKQVTQPVIVFNGIGGTVSPQCRFVEGKFGKGLALFTRG